MLVCNVIVVDAAPAPIGVMLGFVTTQSELAGAPLQVTEVLAVYPPLGVSVMVVLAGFPCVTVVLPAESESVKSGGGAAVMVTLRGVAEIEPEKVAAPP
jgi:hypothetical protein